MIALAQDMRDLMQSSVLMIVGICLWLASYYIGKRITLLEGRIRHLEDRANR